MNWEAIYGRECTPPARENHNLVEHAHQEEFASQVDNFINDTIGTPELIAVWTDPDFDPAHSAFYYGRVIEIPTPRWIAYDTKKYGIKLPAEVPVVTQERAYTSPTWYTP